MEASKQKKSIWAKVVLLLGLIVVIFAGGYVFLDKLIVPKYFAKYGINGVGELVNVVSSLYRNPKESTLIKNGYTVADLESAIDKMQTAGYKIQDNGSIKEEDLETFKGSGRLELTDREFAAICNELLENGFLEKNLTNVNYLNITKLSVLDFIISPDETTFEEETKTYTKANVSFVIKVDTTKLREQIAEQMDTPIYLLKMIIPDNLYFEIKYDVDLNAEQNNRTNGSIAINGRDPKRSETLINLLIDFIFGEDSQMDIDKFTNEVGNVALQGIDALGSFKFYKFDKNKQYGFVVNEV